MLIPQNGDRADLYLRLSRDDDTKKESYSITTQRKILTAYAEEHGFKVIDEYIDDGISGTSFHRPGFDRMIEDAKAGKINVIIVKDLSRLGRNYLGSGDHIENVFPKLGVRFISIVDNYDSLFDDEPSADGTAHIPIRLRRARLQGYRQKAAGRGSYEPHGVQQH